MMMRKVYPLIDVSPEFDGDELSTRVAEELQGIMGYMFPSTENLSVGPYSKEERGSLAKNTAEFAGAAATILADILSREQSGKISKVRSCQLIKAFIVACSASGEARGVSRDVIDRLSKKLGTLKGQQARAVESAIVDQTISECAEALWQKNPKRRASDLGTAKDIYSDVNAKLKEQRLKARGVEAIRKRVAKIQRERKRSA